MRVTPIRLLLALTLALSVALAWIWVDEHGRLFLDTDLGLGLVHTLDMGLAADAVERGTWAPQEIRFDELPARFGYRLSPAAAHAAQLP